MTEAFEPTSRILGGFGYLLNAANLAFWFWLVLRAKRARELPHFVTEAALFLAGLLFFVALFVSVAAAIEWRASALLWVRGVGLLLGVLFTAHSVVAVRVRTE